MATAGTLEIQLLADVARLRSDMQQATGVVTTAAKSMDAAVAGVAKTFASLGLSLSAGAFVAIIKGVIDAADHLNDLSKSTGLAIETLVGLRIAAKQSGSDLDSLAASINKLSVNAGKSADKFAALGITATDPLEKMMQFADIFNAIEDPALKAALAADVLGKSWATTAPFLAEGSAKMREMVTAGTAASGMTKEFAQQSDAFNDKLALLIGTGGFLNRTVAALLPLLNALADTFIENQKNAGALGNGLSPLTEILRTIIVLGGNVVYVFKQMGDTIGGAVASIGAINEGLAALQRGDVSGFVAKMREVTTIDTDMQANAAKARTEFDHWERSMMAAGTATRSLARDMGELDQVERRMALPGARKAASDAAEASARARSFLAKDEKKAIEDLLGPYRSLEKALKDKLLDDKEATEVNRTIIAIDALSAKAKAALTAEMIAHLLVLADSVDQKKADAEALKVLVAAELEWLSVLKEINDVVTSRQDAVTAGILATEREIEQIEFSTSLIGRNVAERIKLESIRALALKGITAETQGYDELLRRQTKALTDSALAQTALDLPRKMADEWRAAGADIAESLTRAFGTGGAAVGGMVKAFADGSAQQILIAEKYANARKEIGADIVALNRKEAAESTSSSLKMYGDMAGAAASFFDKQSDAYKVLHGIEQAMYAARLASQLADLAVSLGIISAKTSAEIASIGPSLAAGAASMFAQSGWGGFVGVAAMLAVMAGLGFSGGGGGTSMPSAGDAQRTQGTGTVLGDSSAKSQSIENALKQIQSIDTLGLTYTRQMTEYLSNISNNMSSLVGALSRVTGLTDPRDSGISQGTTPTGIHGVVNASNRIIDPLGGFSLIPGHDALMNRIFGTITTNIINAGIAMMGTVADAMRAPRIDNQANIVSGINSFFTVNTNRTGLFGSSNTDHDEWRSLPPGTLQQLQGFLGGVVDSVEAAAKALGIWSPQLRDMLLNIPLDVKLSLDGLKGQELSDAVNAFFSSIADKIALGLPTLSGAGGIGFDSAAFFATFQRAGEGAFETLIRVATEFETVNHTFAALGLNINLTGLEAMKATDNIVKLSGGLDKFQQQAASYLSHYYSPQEQRNITGQALGSEFASMGFAMPTDPAGFRRLVEGLDLTTEAGQKFYARLMALEGTFYDFSTQVVGLDGKMHSVSDAVEQHTSLQQRLDVLMGKKTQNQVDYENALATAIDQTSLQLIESIHLEEQRLEIERLKKEAVAGQTSLFNQFASEQQKADKALRDVTVGFAALGLEVPKSSEAFAAFVAAIDTTTDQGQALVTALLALAPALGIVLGQVNALIYALADPLNPNRMSNPGGVGGTTLGGSPPIGNKGPGNIPSSIDPEIIAQQRAAVGGLNLELLRLIPGATAAAEVTRLVREARMAELTAQEAQLGLAPGTLTAIQTQINAQQDLNDAQTAAAEATARAASELADFGASMDKLHGNNAYSMQIAQWNAGNSMAAVSAAMPWIKDLNQMMSMAYGDFTQYSDANRKLILDALRAAGALKDLTDSASKAANGMGAMDPSKYNYEWVPGAGGFGYYKAVETPETIAARQAAAAKAAQDTALARNRVQMEIYKMQGVDIGDPNNATAKLMRELRQVMQDMEEAAIGDTGLRALTHEFNQLQNAAADGAKALELANQKLEARTNIQKYLDSMLLGQNSPLTDAQRLIEARKQYESQLGLAQGGDLGALQGITQFSSQYEQAAAAVYGHGGPFSAIWQSIRAELGGLANPASMPTAGDNFVAKTIQSEMSATREQLVTMQNEYGKLMERLIAIEEEGHAETADAVERSGTKVALSNDKAAAIVRKS